MQRQIGDDAAYREGVGALRDGVVGEVQFSGLTVDATVRQPDLDHHRIEATLGHIALPQLKRLAHRDRESHIHRILADDGGEHPGTRTDDIAVRHRGATDHSVDRRTDLGVIEVDLREFHLRLGSRHLSFEAALVGDCGVIGRLHSRGAAEEGSRALSGQLGVFERRLQLRHLRLLRRKIGLEWTAFKLVEQIASLDLGAFTENPLVHECSHASDYIDAVRRLDAAEEFAGFSDGSRCGLYHADGGRPAWRWLRLRCCIQTERNRSRRQQPDR